MADMKIGFYGHVKQYHNLKAEIDRAIHEVLESGSYVLGPQLVKFEQELAQYMNAKETVGLNSGTDALLLTFLALGIGPGDEVITTSNTFFATAEAIWLAGATPVLVDIDPRTFTLDPNRLEDALRQCSRPKAVVPVHLYGHPADMPAIGDIARRYGLRVIEDCAQAHGASLDNFALLFVPGHKIVAKALHDGSETCRIVALQQQQRAVISQRFYQPLIAVGPPGDQVTPPLMSNGVCQ